MFRRVVFPVLEHLLTIARIPKICSRRTLFAWVAHFQPLHLENSFIEETLPGLHFWLSFDGLTSASNRRLCDVKRGHT